MQSFFHHSRLRKKCVMCYINKVPNPVQFGRYYQEFVVFNNTTLRFIFCIKLIYSFVGSNEPLKLERSITEQDKEKRGKCSIISQFVKVMIMILAAGKDKLSQSQVMNGIQYVQHSNV